MDETNSRRYSRFAMPLGGAAARELIMDQLSPGIPLKRIEIARRIGDAHHSRGGRPMDRDKLIGVAKKELALMLKEGIVEQPAPGWYSLSGAEPVQKGDYSDSYPEPIEESPKD